MKILQIAPIDIAVSDKLKYAGTERIVYALNREYYNRGLMHALTASGDSDINGKGILIPTVKNSLWTTNKSGEERRIVRSNESYEIHYRKSLEYAIKENFEIIHDHPGQYVLNSQFYLNHRNNFKIPIITTIHEDIRENVISKLKIWEMLQKEKRKIYFIGISKAHKRKYERKAGIEVFDFVYNGLELNKFPFVSEKQNYMFWIGRVSDIKGADIAVQVALKTGIPLIIAGEVHDDFKQFYENRVNPYITNNFTKESYEIQEQHRKNLIHKLENGEQIIDDRQIFFIGPVDDRQKSVFYKYAKVVLVPNRWEEPFGLISIEGMASGTPIIGTNRGALPEVIKHEETGYIANVSFNNGEIDEKNLVDKISEFVYYINLIDPKMCRKRIEENFTSEIMADNYLKIYEKVLNL